VNLIPSVSDTLIIFNLWLEDTRPPPTALLRVRSIPARSPFGACNRTKSKVRTKVEHPIGVIKRVFGFVKVRDNGLAKNAHRLVVTCALANLFMVRQQLLCCHQA
jgi:hypothetical protein